MKRLVIAATCVLYLLPLMAAPAKNSRVLDVQQVTVTRSGSTLTIDARGETSTPGWTDESLRLLSSNKSEIVFEFVGVPPSGIVPQLITPAHARTTWSKPLPRRVRVKAKTNEKVTDVPSTTSTQTVAAASATLTVIGKLTAEGVECQAMREDGTNILYTLTGDLQSFKAGDHVKIVGSPAQISTCIQETTIVLQSITAVP